jgi:sugar phosphate isomerase/epimerase
MRPVTRRDFLGSMAAGSLLAAAPAAAVAAGPQAAASAGGDAAAIPKRTAMGLAADSFQSIRFSTPERLLPADRLMEIAAKFGAAGAQGGMVQIDFDWARRMREMKERLGLYLEIQTFIPKDGEDPSVFEHAVRVAKDAGATSLRAVCLLGRRYEMFETLADWKAAVAAFHRQIAAAVPVVEKHRMPLGIENHKDWRLDEQLALLKQYSSEYLGVTLDTNNNLSLLDDPMGTIEQLAPYTVTVHLKDTAFQEYEHGFLLSEVPLGEGMLDMKRVVETIRRARPDVHLSLEMITRDPLEIPCLTDKYWATFDDVNGLALARMLSLVRAHKPRAPLPRITGLTPEARLALEMDLVERSIVYARDHLGL